MWRLRPDCRSISRALFSLLLVFGSAGAQHSAKKGQSERVYVTQQYVDSLVAAGFFILSEASALVGPGRAQERGIEEARQVVQRLRQLAQGDRNQKYILWKVSELEQQIFLEYQEVRQKKLQETRRVVNRVVDMFNAEIGKRRPDFSVLVSVRDQMLSVDSVKAEELERSMRDRSRNLSREVVYCAQQALSAKEFDRARRELDYCSANRRYLQIPAPTFDQLAAKLRVSLNLAGERARITKGIARAQALLANDSLAAATDACSDARSRVAAVRSLLSRGEMARYSIDLEKACAAIDQRENQLVQENLAILSRDGIDAAIDFHDNVLKKKHGVSRLKTVVVNNAILALIMAQRAARDTAMSTEMNALVSQEGPTDLDRDVLMSAVKKRAQERADSIREAREREEQRLSLADQRRIRRGEKDARRRERPAQNSAAGRGQEESPTVSMSQSSAPAGRTSAAAAPVTTVAYSQDANDEMLAIYTLIEQDNIRQAQSAFLRHREILRAQLIPEAFDALQATVMSAGSPPSK
jgi:hypothetical protein